MKKVLIPLAIIALLGVICYINSFGNEFVYDDEHLIVENEFIKNVKFIPKIFSTDLHYFDTYPANFYRPLVATSFMLTYSLFGLNVWGYHLINTVLHIVAGLLAFFFVLAVSQNKKVSLISSILFVTFPLQTEAVTYISGRNDPLMAVFLLSSIILFIKGIRLGSILLFVLALLSKETALALPFILLFYELIFRKRETFKQRFMRYHLPFWIILLVYVVLRLTLLNFSTTGLFSFEPSAIYPKALSVLSAYHEYFRLILWPTGLHFSRQLPAVDSIFHPKFLAGVIFLLLLLIVFVATFKRKGIISFGIFFFFITLYVLPMSAFIPLYAKMMEHWLYLPSLGIFMIFATLACDMSDSNRFPALLKDVGIFLLTLLIIFYGFTTVRRNMDWKENIAFYQNALLFVPQDGKLLNNLGLAYEKEGFLQDAEAYYRKALSVNPNIVEAHYNLGNIYYKSKNDPDSAISKYKEALAIKPDYIKAHNNLSCIYAENGRLEESIKHLYRSLSVRPNPVAYNNMGVNFEESGKFNEAMACYVNAIKLKPDYGAAYSNLGNIYFRRGDEIKAKELWQRASNFTPSDVRPISMRPKPSEKD